MTKRTINILGSITSFLVVLSGSTYLIRDFFWVALTFTLVMFFLGIGSIMAAYTIMD